MTIWKDTVYSKRSCDIQSCLHLCSQLPAGSGVKDSAAGYEEICVWPAMWWSKLFCGKKRHTVLKENCSSLLAEPNVFLHRFHQFVGTIVSPLFALYSPFACTEWSRILWLNLCHGLSHTIIRTFNAVFAIWRIESELGKKSCGNFTMKAA